MSKYRNALMVTVVGLLVAGGLWLAYEADVIGGGTSVFLGILLLTLGVVAVVFLKRMGRPAESVEQMLYETDHPTRT